MVPATVVTARVAAAASADQLATQAAMASFQRGGNAADAAIAANAVLAVTAPHLCGIGGDLFALVHDGRDVHALNASGRAGSGVDPSALRAEGLSAIPLRHHPSAVTIPGCVDGWMALHSRFGSLPLGEVLDDAISLAGDGFPASPLLVGSLAMLDDVSRANLVELAMQATVTDAIVTRPGIARTLGAVAAGGRAALYQGEFGEGLGRVTGGIITDDDLAATQADWQAPLSTQAFGVTLHTVAPNSQGTSRSAGRSQPKRSVFPTIPTARTGSRAWSGRRCSPASIGQTCCMSTPTGPNCWSASPTAPALPGTGRCRTGEHRGPTATPRTCARRSATGWR